MSSMALGQTLDLCHLSSRKLRIASFANTADGGAAIYDGKVYLLSLYNDPINNVGEYEPKSRPRRCTRRYMPTPAPAGSASATSTAPTLSRASCSTFGCGRRRRLPRARPPGALFTAKNTVRPWRFPWITRVPETIAGTRELILAAFGEWLETRPERAYAVLRSSYGGVKQRWLVVYTQAALLYAGSTKSRTWLSLFEGSLVYGEHPVSQVAEAQYDTDDDHDTLSVNLRSSGIPHLANAPTAPTNVCMLIAGN